MSFKDEVENIIGHYPECDYNLSKGKDLCDCYAGETAQSIINLVDKELPERKTMTNVPLILPSADDNWGRAQASREGFMYGYNQAIYDIRSKLHA